MCYQSFTVNTYMLLKANSDKSEGAVIYLSWRSLILGGNSYVFSVLHGLTLVKRSSCRQYFPID